MSTDVKLRGQKRKQRKPPLNRYVQAKIRRQHAPIHSVSFGDSIPSSSSSTSAISVCDQVQSQNTSATPISRRIKNAQRQSLLATHEARKAKRNSKCQEDDAQEEVEGFPYLGGAY